MTAREKIEECIMVLGDASLYTSQKDIVGRFPIYKPWHLKKDGTIKCFDNQTGVAEFLGITAEHLSKAYNGHNGWLKANGYTLIKLELVDGKVRIKQ